MKDIKATIQYGEAWISPSGEYYSGNSHALHAKYILEQIYGKTQHHFNIFYYSDELEKMGWIKVSESCMWEIRLEDGYFTNRQLTQKQFDALWDWCKLHNKKFPTTAEVK